MDNIELYYLLKIVKRNSNLNSLRRAGFSYTKIAEFTELAVENELLMITESGITLTKNGEEKLLQLKEINKKVNKDEWINVEFKSQRTPFPSDFVYLPDQNELF